MEALYAIGLAMGLIAAALGIGTLAGRKPVAVESPATMVRESGGEFVTMEATLMGFTELTPEQQAVLGDYVRTLRAWCGEQARTNNHADALNSAYTHIQASLDLLVADDLIADGSGLAGAMTLTKSEVITLTAHMQGILINYNTVAHRQLWAKAAGASNLIG